ncbi:SusC/RagA family TonB-linked outer membrane protein [Hymenobacter cheonanensis]|uniref:SusC/RagA family TonB-linked outer membrane protein n=1 Tax=Hymenobacter sp. CA2-7 TaxID=3063993 RepID=UPI0027129267|nr:TonB-dependent receptor [Hymenobacter sp. CA2-7]MDO7888042.1 TonB-dependent receptor [Hymenobacter sp. CA2-7]
MNTRIPSARPLKGLKWSRLVPLLLLSGGLAPLAPQVAYAQVAGTHTVSGRITSDNGEGIPGVTVVVKGTTTGATTDADGNYTVTVPNDNSVLVFSSVGYTRQEVAVGKRTNLSQALVPETQALNEVQVVGYGTQKKSQVTGAISSVSDEQLRDVPVANVGQALQGRAAGITVSSNGTAPGQAPTIRIRGSRSLSGSNDPLLVVDGVPFDGSLNDLNPDDITSLEVLKDASSTAIYGARGANGVILITTRRGKSSAARATYAGYYGMKDIYGRFDLMNGTQYYNYKLEAYRTQSPTFDPSNPSFLTQDERNNYAAGKTTDYQSLLFQKGHIQNHTLGVSGGTEQTQYSASLGYYDETGIVPVQRFQRYSLRATLDQQIGKRVKVGVNSLNTFTNANDPNVNVLYQILTTSPLASPYDQNGQLVLYPNGDNAGSNPLTLYAPNAHLDRSRRLRSFNSIYGQVNIAKGLDYRLNVGLDGRTQADESFYASVTPNNGGGVNTASRSSSIAYNLLAENILTYNRNFAEKHDLNVTALYSRQTYHADGFQGAVRGTLADFQLADNLGAGTPSTVSNNTQPIDWALESYMGRINYAYDNRYSATLTARIDRSSRLAPGHKTNLFPSAAVAWNIANESFLKDYSWLNTLKLRASLGRVGSTAINPYQTQGALITGIGNGYYNYGTTGGIGVIPSAIPNPDLGWEYTTTTNFGLDFGFFQNRLTGSVEVYQQRTSDLLLPDALPTASGYSSFLRNAGQTQNRGVEISLTTVNVRAKDLGGFEWSTDWNFTVNREKVLDLNLTNADGSKRDDVGNQRFIGQPLYVIYDYRNLGVWQASEADQAKKYGSKVGQIKVEDVNGDGVINANDRVIVGSRQPKFEAGLTNRFRFKGFDLTVVALTRVGATVVDPYSFGPSYYATNTGRRNQINFDYYSSGIPANLTPQTPGGVPANPSNTYPEPDQTPRANEWPTYGSTLGYHSGTFIKVRSIDLGYTLPAAWAKAAFMSSTRIYVQVQNPYIWAADKYFQHNKAIDPDALSYSTRFDSSQGVNAANISFQGGSNYPVTRAFIVGVNLGF